MQVQLVNEFKLSQVWRMSQVNVFVGNAHHRELLLKIDQGILEVGPGASYHVLSTWLSFLNWLFFVPCWKLIRSEHRCSNCIVVSRMMMFKKEMSILNIDTGNILFITQCLRKCNLPVFRLTSDCCDRYMYISIHE